MSTQTPGTSGEFSRVVNNTIADFFKKEVDGVMRKRVVTAFMQEKGRVTFNHGGDELKWQHRYKRASFQQLGDSVNLSFPRTNKRKGMVLPWPDGLAVLDSLPLRERLINKGKAAIINTASTIAETLRDDIKDNFAGEWYKDYLAAANSGRMAGFESFFGESSSTALTKVVLPSDTYAGQSTATNLAGSWTGTWPDGDGTPDYDWNSPLIVDPTLAGWAATTKTWPNTCLEAIKYALHTQLGRTGEMPSFGLLTRSSFTDMSNKIESKETIFTQRSAANSLMVKLGFGTTLNYEGLDFTFEQGVDVQDTSVNGYMLDVDEMELCCLTDQLFVPMEVDWSLPTLTDRYMVYLMCQLKSHPRSQVKLVDTGL